MPIKRLWFAHLIRQERPKLVGFARRLTRNPAAAEDLVQAACLKALTRLHQLKDRRRFVVWMLSIIRTTHLDTVRRHREPVMAEIVPLPSPEGVLQSRRLGDTIIHALDVLPENQRAAVWLVDVEQLTFSEAAEVLELRVGTVASRVARGRAALRIDLVELAQERGLIN